MPVCTIDTLSCGGKGGTAFDWQYVNTLSLRTGAWMDRIVIDGLAYGGQGGQAGKVIALQPDEYIDGLQVGATVDNRFVGYLKVTTNKGQTLEGGVKGGRVKTLSDVRVLAIGGHAGQYVDSLQILYIKDYSGPQPDPRYYYPIPDSDFVF